MALYKTTIVIWSEYPGDTLELTDLAREADSGDAYCSHAESRLIADPQGDSDWDGTEFFGLPDGPGEDELEQP
jgi:hypothetical protein